MQNLNGDHMLGVLIAFVAALIGFVVLAILGSDGWRFAGALATTLGGGVLAFARPKS